MKTLNTIVLAMSAAAVLGSNGLYAGPVATATVPFDFVVMNQTLPAGQYTLWTLSQTSHVIEIRNVASKESAAVIATPSNSKYKGNGEKEGALIFHCYGDRCFFSEIWTRTGDLNGAVLPSKLEREVRASSQEKMASVSLAMGAAGQ